MKAAKGDAGPNFMTVAEIADELRVTRRFVSNLAARGDLPAYKIGRVWRVARADYLGWLKKRRPKQWRTFTSVAVSGGSAFKRAERKSESPLEPLLKLKPSGFSAICGKHAGETE
jgi:excisionase family DNA binding protein